MNIESREVVERVTHRPMPWLKANALVNISLMSWTACVCQRARFWLKAKA